MGCKQFRACYNNYMNNFLNEMDKEGNRNWVNALVPDDADQCRPEAGIGEVSVCRQCCDFDAKCSKFCQTLSAKFLFCTLRQFFHFLRLFHIFEPPW